jgi:hypothetical protein
MGLAAVVKSCSTSGIKPKLAVTFLPAFMVTEQAPLPLQCPDQLVKV